VRIDTISAAPACPPPIVDTTTWTVITATEVPAEVRLPANYREKHYAVKVGDLRQQEWRGDLFTTFEIEASTGPDSLGGAGIVVQSWYQDYTECRVEIGGHSAIVQSLRGGTIFWEGREYRSYDVFATIQLAPRRYLRVSATAPTRSAQEVHLVALRTIRVRADSVR